MTKSETLDQLVEIEVQIRALQAKATALKDEFLGPEKDWATVAQEFLSGEHADLDFLEEKVGKRKMSDAARKRISEAQKKRWATQKEGEKFHDNGVKKTKPFRTLAEKRKINKRVRAMNAARLAKKAKG